MLKELVQDWLGLKKESSAASALVSYYGEKSAYNPDKALAAFDDNVWVNAAVNLRSEVFASANFYLWNEKKKERIDQHEVLSLLKKPSDRMTRFGLLQNLCMHLDLVGDAYWKYDMEGTKIKRIRPLLPQNVTTIYSNDPDEYIKGYSYIDEAGRSQTYPAKEVTHFMSANPSSVHKGSAPLSSARYSIETENSSNKWNYHFFKNGANTGAILEHDNALPDPVKDKIKEAFDARHRGEDKTWKTIVLDNKLKLREPKISQRDMEFSKLQETNRDKVIGVYRVPKILLAQFEGGSLAEARTAENIFAKYTITPLLKSFCETIDLDLLPLFKNTEGLVLKYDSIVQDDKDYELKKRDAAVDVWMTRNERRKIEGIEGDMEGGDVLYAPMSNVPLGYDITEEEPKEEPKEDKSMQEQFKVKQARVMLKNLPEKFKAKWETKFLLNHGMFEVRFIKKLKKVFADQKSDVLASLKDNKNYAKTKSLADDVFDTAVENERFKTAFKPLVAEIVATLAGETDSFFGLGVGDISSLASFQRAVNGITLKFAQEVNSTTKKQIRNQLAEGLAGGEGVDELAARIRSVYKEASELRSQVIARTETTKSSSTGSLLTYEESKVVDGKEWLTTLDDRTREDHAAANAQQRKLKEPFNVGGEELMAPGIGGSAFNVVNCRCTILPVIIN